MHKRGCHGVPLGPSLHLFLAAATFDAVLLQQPTTMRLAATDV